MIHKLSILLLFLFTSIVMQAQHFNLATFNVRYDNKGDSLNAWTDRLPAIVQMIRFHGFDLFGAQEVLSNQLDGLLQNLPEFGYVGVGRDGERKGEFSPIFYNKSKFTLIKSGTFWLSETPDKLSKGWDAALTRICTWAQLEEKDSKKKFFLFNTHFDHRGIEARKKSAALILEQIKKIAGDSPTLLCGDFNVDQNNESYTLIQNSKEFKDAFTTAPIKMANNGTFNSFDITSKTDRRIDHIFVGRGFEVKRYGILTDTYQGKFPSDHFPVLIEVVKAGK
jgi:endonuclease/exonuclease/phosphatase family metal-dependent hydrolase